MRIIIATGGSGGHIFPALRVANEFRAMGHEVSFMGVFGQAGQWVTRDGYAYHELKARGLTTESLKSLLTSCFSMLQSILESRRLVRQIKPQVIVGFGGYGAFPVVFAGILLRCPTLIHEQNVVPGKANSLLGKWVTRVAVSFKKTENYFQPSRVVWAGCPCRTISAGIDRIAVLREFGFEASARTILVLGGSQGSRRINQEFIKTLPLLKEKGQFQIIHVSGDKDYSGLKDQYAASGLRYVLFPFCDAMEKVYTAADLIIARAGAVTITEIAQFKRPAILIPYPFAGGHQRENALALMKVLPARIIEERDLSARSLQETIALLLDRRADTAVDPSVDIFRPDAARRIAQEALSLSR